MSAKKENPAFGESAGLGDSPHQKTDPRNFAQTRCNTQAQKTIDWYAIRDLALALNRPIGTLIALARQNDPFYLGELRMRDAEWFAALYREYGFGRGVHIRRIHYRLVSQRGAVQLPGGGYYVNTRDCQDTLGEAACSARYAGLVDPKDFDDRRNPEPMLFLAERVDEPSVSIIGESIDDFDMLYSAGLRVELPRFVVPDSLPTPSLDISAPFQWPFHLEVWCEKSTVNDVLEPLGRQFGLNVQTGVGEISVTRCEQLVERAGDRPVRILYISDFDPGGVSMPLAAGRKIEFFARDHKCKTGVEFDIQLHPIVLTHDQCVEYALPRTPIKEKEIRAPRFEARFGEGATELDALEALYPGELRRILVCEIERFRDPDFADEWVGVRDDAQEALDEITTEVLARHAEAMDALEQRRADLKSLADERLADLQWQVDERLADLRPLAEEQMADLRRQADQLLADLAAHNAAITDDLEAEAPDPAEFEWPYPAEGWDDPLLDSTRDYVVQVDRYKAHQGKLTGRKTSLTSTICTVCGTSFEAGRPGAKHCSDACHRKARQLREGGSP